MAKKRRSRKKRKASSEELYRENNDDRTNRKRNREGLISRKWIVGLSLLALFLFFLPTIVVNTPLKQLVINKALASFHGTVEIESISCGWIANTRLNGVVAKDEEGELLFSAHSVRIPKSLTSMMNATDMGTIKVIEPIIHLKLRSDGSNLEDAIADMFGTSDNSDAVRVRVVIENAQADVVDMTNGNNYQLNKVAAELRMYQPGDAPMSIEFEGHVPGQLSDGAPGRMKGTLSIDGGEEKLQFANGKVEIEATSFPVAVASPFVSRFLEPLALTGTLEGKVGFAWKDSGSTIVTQMAPATMTDLSIRAPLRIGSDEIRLDNTWLQGEFSMTPQSIQATNLVCQTGIGSVRAHGEMNWEQIVAAAGGDIPANDFQAEGQINLAPLITMLPNTLPLQSGMQIESGTVQFNANSRVEGSDRRLVVNVESSGLTAIRNRKRINWDKPARLVAAIRQTPNNTIIVESLDCKTGFMTLNGSATGERGQFHVTGDMDSALAEINQFFDLGDIQLAGNINGNLAWQFDGRPGDPLASRPLRIEGRFRVDQPQVHLPGQTSWAEDEINVVIEAAGQLVSTQSQQTPALRLDAGKFELTNARQSLQADLAEPVTSPSLVSTWKLDCKIAGEVESWLAQLATWSPLQVQARGVIDARGQISLGPEQLIVHNCNYQFDHLKFNGLGLTVDEPQVTGDASLVFERQRGQLLIDRITMASSALSATGIELVVNTGNSETSPLAGPTAGKVAMRADLNRFMAWVGSPARSDAIQWYGDVQGTLDLAAMSPGIGGSVAVKVDNLVAVKRQPAPSTFQNVSSQNGQWVRLLEEESVTLDTRLQLSPSLDQIRLDDVRLTSSAINLTASGSIARSRGLVTTDLRGDWSPDWHRLSPLVDALAGGIVRWNGVQGGQFQIQGPLLQTVPEHSDQGRIHPELRIATVASWQNAGILGMPVGQGNVNMQLAQGIASMDSNAIPFSGGVLRFSPRVDLRGKEMILRLPQGNLLEQVQLTPEICRGWLKFVAPVIADATSAQGKLSVATSVVEVPLQRLTSASVEGVATVHGANIGPGPLGQQLTTLVAQVKALAGGQPLTAAISGNSTWLVMPEQQIPFAVQQGRVHHRRMQFEIDGVVIATSGSVGFDQTMQLVAEIPVSEKWVGDSRWTQGLKGQIVRVPIAGTVSSPRVDQSGLQQMSQQLLRQAASGVINNEVQGLIEKGNQRLEDELLNGLNRLLDRDK